ncbi:hypothetical protein UFOVP550_7 [uncultured Caudovirales phage]|uniref:Uncharacterized protein n=1 Tax=uncultured Caudovirales phage TaxID=2100421 RepID=A0A6J5MX67_9CAUD|nr:hypothetical protein UFOVP550_7 [uncultured Caudovirales phage]
MPVKLQGAVALRKALLKFEPDLAKETTKEIAGFVKPIARNARGFVPSNDSMPSGWLKRPNAKGRWSTRYFDSAELRRGISFKSTPSKPNSKGFRALASVLNKSQGGYIYEIAGRTAGVVGNFTPRLGGELKGSSKRLQGRLIFRAFEQDRGKATTGVLKAIQKSADRFNARTGNL